LLAFNVIGGDVNHILNSNRLTKFNFYYMICGKILGMANLQTHATSASCDVQMCAVHVGSGMTHSDVIPTPLVCMASRRACQVPAFIILWSLAKYESLNSIFLIFSNTTSSFCFGKRALGQEVRVT
jgi:hypothetical protein